MNMKRFARLLAGTCVGLAAATGVARADQWVFGTGLNYTNGDYGEDQDTTVYVVPFSAGYQADRWSFSVTVPYIDIEGSGNVIPGAVSGFGPGASSGGAGAGVSGNVGGVNGGLGLNTGGGLINVIVGPPPPPPPPGPPPPPAPPVTIHERGLGDVTLSGSFTPFVSESGGRWSISGDARLPTGDEEKSLGAGEVIGSLLTSFAQPIGEQSAVYVAAGYQHAFESDQGGATAGIGAETYFDNGLLLGASVDWADSTVDGSPSQSTATLYAGQRLSDHVRLAGFVSGGLTETSPDIGAGVRLIWRP